MIMKLKQENIVPESLADSGDAGEAPDQISFIFMQFSTNILPKMGFCPRLIGWRPLPRLGNLGSATVNSYNLKPAR